jgi:hypothetical protein
MEFTPIQQINTTRWDSTQERLPSKLTVKIEDAQKPEHYPALPSARLSSWRWYNPLTWAPAVIRWAFNVDGRFQQIASDLKAIVDREDSVENKVDAALSLREKLSWADRFRIGRWDDRFRKITQTTLGGSLANMQRDDLQYGNQTHTFMRYRRVETGDTWRYEVDQRRGVPTSYQPGAQMDDVGNLRIVLDDKGHPIAGGCSVPNDVNKALESVLPMVRAKIANGEINNGDEVPVVVHALLSPTRFTSGETKMLRQEIEAFDAIAKIEELTVVCDGKQVTIKLVPMVIDTQTNFFNVVRDIPILNDVGFNQSDEMSLKGLAELCHLVAVNAEEQAIADKLTALKDATCVEEIWHLTQELAELIPANHPKERMRHVRRLLVGRDGVHDRLSAPTEARLIKELSDSLNGIYIAHCKSGLDRTSLILAQILKTNQVDAAKMIDKIFIAVTFMSTGFCGFKWGDKKSIAREVVGTAAVDLNIDRWLGDGQLRKS